MKIIVSNIIPFSLAHGGAQTLIESLMSQARSMGISMEPERWWDEHQKGDILHYFHRPLDLNVQLAKQKGYRVMMTELLDRTASRPAPVRLAQKIVKSTASTLFPAWTGRMGWGVYAMMDALVYVTELEARIATSLFGAPVQRLHVIPHGLPDEEIAQLRQADEEEDYLLCLATIHPRKNQLLLARAAQRAEVPIRFVGRPYCEDDPYFQAFLKEIKSPWTQYEGFVSLEEKQSLYRRARGFVLMSEMESGCYAVYEAAAAGLPQLLPRIPWAEQVYSDIPGIRFTSIHREADVAQALRAFYPQAHRSDHMTFPVASIEEIARQYIRLYQGILA